MYKGTQTTPALALASAEEDGYLLQPAVVTTSFWKHQKGFFFQLTSLEQLCHPPQLDMGMVLPEAKQHREDKARVIGHLI